MRRRENRKSASARAGKRRFVAAAQRTVAPSHVKSSRQSTSTQLTQYLISRSGGPFTQAGWHVDGSVKVYRYKPDGAAGLNSRALLSDHPDPRYTRLGADGCAFVQQRSQAGDESSIRLGNRVSRDGARVAWVSSREQSTSRHEILGKLVLHVSAVVTREIDNLFLDAHSGSSPRRITGKPPLRCRRIEDSLTTS